MINLLLSAAIGDICGMPYEFVGRTKDYNAVDLLNPNNDYTDDTVCTFACEVDERGRVLQKSFPFTQTHDGFEWLP